MLYPCDGQNFCAVKDSLDANRFKIPDELVLEPDASPKHQQMEKSEEYETFKV